MPTGIIRFLSFGDLALTLVRQQSKQITNIKIIRGKYAESVRLDTANHSGNAEFLRIRDFYRNQRDEFLFYLVITYILNIVDAYVGAVLYDFDVSNDLGGSAAIQVRIPFH